MSTQVTTTENQPPKVPAVVAELQAMMPKFKAVLPPHVPAERFMRVCLSAINQKPELLECDTFSLLQSALTAAQLGLEPDANLGQAYFVPFYDSVKGIKRCQLIPGYKGYLALARNSGEVTSISAREVCQHDTFDFEYGLEEKLIHKPSLDQRGEVTHVYCVVRFKDGSHHIEVMTRLDVENIRKRSKMSGKGPWVTDWNEMAKKTVIRRAAKYMPLSVQKAATMENNAMAGNYASLTEHGDVTVDVVNDQFLLEDQSSGSSRLDQFENDLPEEKPPEDPPVDPPGFATPFNKEGEAPHDIAS